MISVLAPCPTQLRWTADEWQSVWDTLGAETGLGIYLVDIPIAEGQKALIRFTFFWTAAGRWEGRDYSVNVSENGSTMQ